MHTKRVRPVVFAMIVLAGCGLAATSRAVAGPDLTKVLPDDLRNTQNLGPTGLQGWMPVEWYQRVPGDMTRTPLTVDTRQIYVTAVAEGSPADGVIQVGDVILGIGDTPFEGDPRVALADAINQAEKAENGGSLKLLCWRPDEPDEDGMPSRPAGRTHVKELKLNVLGSYSDTAPYNCDKSEAILKQAVDAMLSREQTGMDLFYLALLATGEEDHLEIVRTYVQSIVSSVPEPSLEVIDGARSWHTGYRLIMLSEYYLITADETVLPAIENLALTLSKGQSMNGTWGHRMAMPSRNDGRLHGRLEGYADLNQPSLTAFLGLVLARKCGVEHPKLTAALDRSSAFYRRYVGNGAVPYGYGTAMEYMQSNNGTSGSASLAFALHDETDSAAFFSRMSVGAGPKLEVGHTGPFFNTMWTGLGANVSGPSAYTAFFQDWKWLRTLTRTWDGGFVYQRPGGGSFNYRPFSPDAAMVLHYALPRRKLLITGRAQDESLWLNEEDAHAAANVWSIDYAGATDDALLALLGHEIPMVRGFAARELASRDSDTIDALRGLLSGARSEKIGACNALARMAERAAPAQEELMAVARDEAESPWVRSRAVRALTSMGGAAHAHVPELLQLLNQDNPHDPRRYFEQYAGLDITGMARNPSFDAAPHQDLIHAVALHLMGHPHAVGRRHGMTMIADLSIEDFHFFADRIVEVIRNDNLAYTSSHADRPRQIGLDILERFHISEGIQLAAETLEPDRWGYWRRIRHRMPLLLAYGAAAQPYLPNIREGLRSGDQDHEVLAKIENATETRELISLEEARKKAAE